MKNIGLLPTIATMMTIVFVSCGKLEDRINSLEQRISELEDTRIPSIDEQVTSIKKTIIELGKTDSGLKEYISSLEEKSSALEKELGKTNTALAEAQKTLREEMAVDKSELSENVDAAKSDVIAQLEAYKTLANEQLKTLSSAIDTLKIKDNELQQKITDLQAYVNSENNKMKDWATGTFATIEQQNAMAETVASIKTQLETLNTYTMNMDVRLTNRTEELSKSLSALDESTKQQISELAAHCNSSISTLKSELTESYTKLVASEISKLETSMQSWVNDKLSGYYTIEETDAKLSAMQSELNDRISSEKAYLVSLITNLEITTNKKISTNASLITSLRNDLSGVQQNVAENAGKLADDAILISQNTQAISGNSQKIADNTKDISAIQKLVETNQGLISDNAAKINEMQSLLKTLNDSGIKDYAETIVKNSKDITANASMISKNAAQIQSNFAAIVQNRSDIQKLKESIEQSRISITEAYTAAISKAINDYNGVITSKLAENIAQVEVKVQTINSELESIKTRISTLEDKVARLEEIVSQIASISYIPRYSDGIERVDYTRDALDIIPGDVTLRFDVHPASAASEIAANWESILSARAVYTWTKAGAAGDFVDLKVKSAAAENGILSVTVSTNGLNKEFMLGNLSASVALKLTSSAENIVSTYVRFEPSYTEEKQFIYYLLNNFDTDGDGGLELSAIEQTTELNISGMRISTLDGVLEKMPNLEMLDCSNNYLNSINLSKNVVINKLYCNNNNLTNLDTSNNPSLAELNCSNNKILYLDLSSNKSLFDVDFTDNKELIGIKSYGMDIDGVKWMIYNCGSTATASYGNLESVGASPDLTYDMASVSCPSGWRLPTKDELSSLASHYSELVSYKGVKGRWFSGSKVFSQNVNRIFLPVRVNSRNSKPLEKNGIYWSKTYSRSSGNYSYNYVLLLDIYNSKVEISDEYVKSRDCDARCVKIDG